MKVDMEFIINKWKNSNNIEDFQLYICNPFCPTVCSFCAYKGTKYNKEDHNYYQNVYLRELVLSYSDILNSKKIKSIFFGGGTPNLFDPGSLSEICRIIPNFKNIISKQFEIHPAICSVEYIDFLSGLGITCLLFGVQSFNSYYLKKQNRPFADFSHVKKLIDRAKEKMMFTSVDLICYLNYVSKEDVEQFENDLRMVKELQPDVICLQSNYCFNNFNEHGKIYDKEYLISVEEPFINIVKKHLSNSNYRWILEGEFDILQKKLQSKSLRFVDKRISKEDFYSRVYGYFFDGLISKRRSNTLGIGSFGSQMVPTRSWICDEIEYVEINDNWKPSFYVIYDNSKQKSYENLILDEIGEIGEPPLGFELTFKTFIDKDSYTKSLDCSAKWDPNNKTHVDYIEKIKRIKQSSG